MENTFLKSFTNEIKKDNLKNDKRWKISKRFHKKFHLRD